MPRKRGLPGIGELVICKISRVNPNSAFALLDEYDKEGMIHISEICYGWVRDIRKHLKIGQEEVAVVIRVEDDRISLSLKRVDSKKYKLRMKEYKLEQKAEKMLGILAKDAGKKLDQVYEEVGFPLQENFGSIFNGFKEVLKNPESLRGRIAEEWIEPIKSIAEKNIKQKEFILKAKLTLKSYKPNGINIIKDVIREAKNMQMDVKYISAPEYLVIYKTKQAKKGNAEFSEKLEKLSKLSDCVCEVKK